MARTIRTNTKRGIALVSSLAIAGLALAACSGGSSGGAESGDTLKLWHYEGEDSAMGKAWAEAIKVFEEETGATVEFEQKSFEQIQKTASQVLDSRRRSRPHGVQQGQRDGRLPRLARA